MFYKLRHFIPLTIFLYFLICYEYSFSQCSFNLETKVIKNPSCFADGIIEVNLSGSEVDLTKVHISISNGSDVNIPSTKNNTQFETLRPGTYTITASTICKNSGETVSKTTKETIHSDYVIPSVTVKNSLKSLNCLNTGIAEISIFDGKEPFSIEMVSYPPLYTGKKHFDLSNSQHIVIDSLNPGTYSFKVSDDCLYEIPIGIQVEKVSSDFPKDPYDPFLYSLNENSSNCNEVKTKITPKNYNSPNEIEHYWFQNTSKYYEIAFTVNGSTKKWETPFFEDTLILPYSYKQMRDSNYGVEVHLRVKGCPVENLFADKIIIDKNPDVFYSSRQITCDIFSTSFSFGQTALLCYPSNLKIYDQSHNLLDSIENITHSDGFHTSGLKYNKYYYAKIEDHEGQILTRNFIFEKQIVVSHSNEECATYSTSFEISPSNSICYPYKIDIYNRETNTLVASKTGITDDSRQKFEDFKYDIIYKVVFTDSKDSIIESLFSLSPSFQTDLSTSYCKETLFKSSLRIYSSFYHFPIGTCIKQLSGPTPAIHKDVTLGNSITSFFPFSSEYNTPEYVDLKEGIYMFEISCLTRKDTVVFQKYKEEIRDFSYTAKNECDGLHVFPKGNYYYNNIPQETFYRNTKTPYSNFESAMLSSSDVGKYFLFPKTGEYVIMIALSPWGCGSDSLTINYEGRFELSSNSVYICKPGDTPHFDLKASGGVTPYSYELLEDGVVVQTNSTGNFVHGDATHQYAVRVTDACGKNFITNLQVIDLSVDLVIKVNNKSCSGDTLFLSCLSLGSTDFLWQGPNFNSKSQNTFFPNISTTDSGIYSLTFQPFGCSDPITQRINISVSTSPAPLCIDTFQLCFGKEIFQPQITDSNNYLVKWYLENMVTECPVPSIPLTSVHTEKYYISRKDTLTGCASSKCELLFIVNPLPTVSGLIAPNVCSGNIPSVKISNSIDTYLYQFYKNPKMNAEILSLVGNNGDLSAEFSSSIYEATTFYIKINDGKCFSTDSFSIGIKHLGWCFPKYADYMYP